MKGTIDQISKKSGTSSKGSWTRWGVRLGEQWFSTLDRDIGKVLVEGATYDFEIEEKGGYQNIIGAVKITNIGGPTDTATTKEPDPLDAELAGQPVASKQVAPKVAPAQNGDTKDRQIARAVALKAAVEFWGERPQSENDMEATKNVLSTAVEYEKWLTR